MQLINMSHVELSHRKSCEWVRESNEVTILGKLVYHHQHSILGFGQGKTFHKIQGDNLPCSSGIGKGCNNPGYFTLSGLAC
jgi:hypothetical protein